MFSLRSALVALTSFFVVSSHSRAAEYKVVAYVPNWIDLQKFADEIPYGKLTHINIAFENPVNAAGDLLFSPAEQALVEKAHAAGVQVLISIGGGSASGDSVLKKRYAALLSEGERTKFALKLAAYVVEHGLDGLDVDLEGPSIDADYGPFVQELKKRLQPHKKLLTAALSRGYGGERVAAETLSLFDWVNIMAYDAKGPWNAKDAGPHSPVEFARENVEYWLERGLPADRAVLGLPFYGYGFGAAFRKRDYPYKELLQLFAGAAEKDEVGDKIWYNGKPAIRQKVGLIVERQLAGAMIWSLDYDVPGPDSLLDLLAGALHVAH